MGYIPNLKNVSLTTPNIISINKYISEFSRKNASKIVIEVSSHGIKQRRTEGIIFDTVVFTNLSHDHMDYHKNMNNYYETKLKLFTEYKSKRKIICIDNIYGKKIIDSIKNKNEIKTVSINNKEADFYASNIIYSNKGIKFTINSRYGTNDVSTKIYGEFSIINILTAIATLATSKSNFIELTNNISKLKSVNGRMNKFHKKGYPITFVDFAHTPEAAKARNKFDKKTFS
jgi:UDP-N-acetylmuramoyl-L-alanyl-D-glutamate--2,6-diaminopimelate ligase